MKKIPLLIVFILLLSLLSGCWSRRELNELALATALAIDKEDDQYLVTVQILNPGEIAGQAQTTAVPVSTYETTGESIFEAIRKLSAETPRRVYLAHLRMVIFGEDLAREGINKVLDILSRDHEIRTDFYIAVAKNQKGSDLLKILTGIDKVPANKIFSSIEVSEKNWAPTRGVQLDDLISEIISEGSNPILTGVYYEGDLEEGNKLQNIEEIKSSAVIKLDHLAAFKQAKLVAWLNKDESKGYNYITDNINSTVVVLPCDEEDDGTITLEVIRSKTDVKASVAQGKPKITITTKPEANVGEVHCKFDNINEEQLIELEKEYEKHLKDIMFQAIDKAKENKTDLFSFGETIHRKDPKAWKSLKENWHNDGFVNLEVDIEIDAEIRRLGTINESFQGKGGG
ncbi:Ger(x)C family spore germination protein [Bacillus sp. Marseille-P3661]|uniref:Ger(x)C family spore germination protein n=1 Tax=Bacillus sp. Marseille-P3661 TaxID=1936234 RepID=UPI000C8249AD|nr:Ger(x)C family spore germination protein [Bacillus sp. Marseille-P3661]